MKKRSCKFRILILIAVYVFSYGGLRMIHFYVHRVGWFQSEDKHGIDSVSGPALFSIPAAAMLCIHFPMKIAEEVYWNRHRLSCYFRSGLDSRRCRHDYQ